MSQQTINLGTGVNTNTGDTVRVAFEKANSNFTELFAVIGPNLTGGWSSNTVQSLISLGNTTTPGDTVRIGFSKLNSNFSNVFAAITANAVTGLANVSLEGPQETINLGVGPNTNTGDTVRTAFAKVNDNFSILYQSIIGVSVNTVSQFGPTVSSVNRVVIPVAGPQITQPIPDYFNITADSFDAGIQLIDLGDGADTQTGDPIRVAFAKANHNFEELYQVFGSNGESNLIANTIIANNFSSTGNLRTGNIYSRYEITTLGNIVGSGFFYPNGVAITGGTTSSYSNANVASYLPIYTGNLAASQINDITGGSLNFASNNYVQLQYDPNGGYDRSNIANGSWAYLSNGGFYFQSNVSGNWKSVTLTDAGDVAADGNVSANYFFGNGALLSGIVSSSGNATFANAAGTASTVTGNLQPNITQVGTLSNLTVSGNVTGTYFIGDGSQLTGIVTYTNANVASYLPVYSGNVNAAYFIGNGSTLTSITGANVTGTVANAAYALQAGQANYANTATYVTGLTSTNVNVALGFRPLDSNAVALTAQYVTANAQPNITSVGVLSSLTSSGNVTANGLTVNNSATIGTDLAVSGTANVGNLSTNGTVTLTSSINASGVNTGAFIVHGGGSIEKDFWVGGNLYTTNLIATSTSNITVQDPLLYLSANTPYPYDYEIGIYSNFNRTGSNYQHTGFIRDHADNTWKLVSNVAEPNGGTVDFTNANVIYDSIRFGNMTALGPVWANSTLSVANTATINSLTVNTTATISGNLTVGNLIANNFKGNAIPLGSNTAGQLVSNAVTLTNTTSVTDAVAQLNYVLGKLVPSAPPTFPGGQSLTISTLSTYRMCNFTQTDNTTGANKSVAGGTSVSNVRRATTYTTSTIANVGPGDSGVVTSYRNGVAVGNVTLIAGNVSGTYGNLVITRSGDYANVSNITPGFWYSLSSSLSGNVAPGWNEVYIVHSGAGAGTNTPYWYYDASAPGTPTWSNTNIALTTNTVIYSSTIPHLTSSSQFTLTGNVAKLSGDMFPSGASSSAYAFVTGTAGGAIAAPSSVTYAGANVTWPLTPNLYVSTGSAYLSTTAAVISGFGSSSTGPSLTADNSYATGATTFSPGVTVLYKTGTASAMEETSITFGSTVGTGSGLAARVLNPGSTDTPAISGNTTFNSQTSTLQTYDATIVAGVLKNDTTNYSTGYLPVGPNLSGQAASQYFTFRFARTSVSKFDIRWSGTIAGLWVALPGSTIDTSSTLNGWLDLSVAYAGAGVPGAGSGGNGSNGAALGGVAPLNSLQTNKSITATFGTVSSSSTVSNEIFVRIKLTSGQTVTALSLQTASN